MKTRFFLFCLLSFCSYFSYAHAPNEAFFDVFESDHKLVIKAEFPWTIRKALLTAMPELKDAETKAEMNAGLLAYLQQNIQIIDLNHQAFTLQRVQELPNNGHGHGSEFLLIFGPYKVIQSIRNSCLFESYPDQKNFHNFNVPNKEPLEFTLTKEQPIFLQETPASKMTNIWIVIILGVMGSLLAVILFVKRNQVNDLS